MNEQIAKQKFNVILLVDVSRSMCGSRIEQVNNAICDIKEYLINLQDENANIDFYLSILTFGTEAKWHTDKKSINVKELKFAPIKAGGQSNLHLAYHELNEILNKESKGGMMPDFGGVAPIIILLTDGHPSKGNVSEELMLLRKKTWFNVALKYGIAIELNDQKTKNVLSNFVSNNGDVIDVYNSKMLKKIIKIIVMTASKVKSKSTENVKQSGQTTINIITQEIQNALSDIDDWEW